MSTLVVLISIALSIPSSAQSTKSSPSARDLYFESVAEDKARLLSLDKPEQDRDLERSPLPGGGVQNLGIRYNVLLFSAKGDVPQPVDPERTFRTGDCIALALQANRAGYLYVLAEGASGEWVPLLPSVLTPDEPNAVNGGAHVQAPTKDCFEFAQPAGIERLFLILSRDVADVKGLLDVFRTSSLARSEPPADPTLASGEAAAKLQDRFGSRDLRLKKNAKPETPDEQPFTVYAVAPAPRLFVEIRLRHQ